MQAVWYAVINNYVSLLNRIEDGKHKMKKEPIVAKRSY